MPEGRGQRAPRHIPTDTPLAPIYVVWELTLRCDLACRHCGSRAGLPREQELSLTEAAEVVRQLAELGTREVSLIGGEAYLNKDWLRIVRLLADAGIRPALTTGARALTRQLCDEAAAAGLIAVSVSVDGLEKTHDTLRAVDGSWAVATQALEHVHASGMAPLANTQINRLNLPELEALATELLDRQVQGWQLQLTGPMGRAADRPEWLLQPYEMLDLAEVLERVTARARAAGCTINAGNNLGYFGPIERHIRVAHFQGCSAGRHVLGIESNGDVKGCPSLPSGPYVGGNVRTSRLRDLWEGQTLAFARDRGTSELWGRCSDCYYAATCQGGCSWTSHTALGRRGNMPWCFHRAQELDKLGRRERLERVVSAEGKPFDFGLFQLIEEDVPPHCT